MKWELSLISYSDCWRSASVRCANKTTLDNRTRVIFVGKFNNAKTLYTRMRCAQSNTHNTRDATSLFLALSTKKMLLFNVGFD